MVRGEFEDKYAYPPHHTQQQTRSHPTTTKTKRHSRTISSRLSLSWSLTYDQPSNIHPSIQHLHLPLLSSTSLQTKRQPGSQSINLYTLTAWSLPSPALPPAPHNNSTPLPSSSLYAKAAAAVPTSPLPHASSHHLFSSRICCSSSGVKSLTMLNCFLISSGVLPLIIEATFAQVRSSRGLMSR